MSRVNKKTRIKGLPPRVQLNVKAAHTGSYPALLRASSDNRTGNYKVFFDDNVTVTFSQSNSMNLGSGVESSRLSRGEYQELGSDLSSSLTATFEEVFVPPPNDSNTVVNYVFDENITDNGPNSIELSASNTLIYVDGPKDNLKALLFERDLLLTSSLFLSPLTNLTGSFTFSSIYKSTSTDGAYRYMFSIGDLSSTDPTENVLASVSQRGSVPSISPAHEHSAGTNVFTETPSLPNLINRWMHVVVTRNGINGEYNIYVDGILVHNEPTTILPDGGSNSYLTVGGRPSGTNQPWFSGSIYSLKITERVYTPEEVLNEYNSTGLDPKNFVYPGFIRKGIADANLLFTPGQALKPFQEHLHVEQGEEGSFYLGETSEIGFQTDVRDKTKIFIDLSPKTECSISLQNFNSSSNNYPMCYWNNDAKIWQGIGQGKEFSHEDYYIPEDNVNEEIIKNTYAKFFDEQPIGFAKSTNISSNEFYTDSEIFDFAPYNSGMPIDNFHFPKHEKFEATASNYIKMSDYINAPFLVEKIVINLSCSFAENRFYGTWGAIAPGPYKSSNPESSLLTFFILNQNGNNVSTIKDIKTVYSMSNKLTLGQDYFSGSKNRKKRELVTWGQIMSSKLTPTNLLETGSLLFGPKLPPGSSGPADYFDLEGNPLYPTYTFTAVNGRRMAADILTANGREIVLGKDHEFVSIETQGIYSASHPEFDTATGRGGAVEGSIGQDPISGLQYLSWAGTIKMELFPKAPLQRKNITYGYTWGRKNSLSTNYPLAGGNGRSNYGFIYTNNFQGRSFNNKTSGRDFYNTLIDAGFPPLDTGASGAVRFGDPSTNITEPIFSYSEKFQINPYMLLPTDNLILGWQLPLTSLLAAQTNLAGGIPYFSCQNLGPELSFHKSVSNITIYGSYVKEGKEYHDTLNQLLSNDNVHEIIGDD